MRFAALSVLAGALVVATSADNRGCCHRHEKDPVWGGRQIVEAIQLSRTSFARDRCDDANKPCY